MGNFTIYSYYHSNENWVTDLLHEMEMGIGVLYIMTGLNCT